MSLERHRAKVIPFPRPFRRRPWWQRLLLWIRHGRARHVPPLRSAA
jgi:hypothetical protein